jgi:hypothetical protein
MFHLNTNRNIIYSKQAWEVILWIRFPYAPAYAPAWGLGDLGDITRAALFAEREDKTSREGREGGLILFVVVTSTVRTS